MPETDSRQPLHGCKCGYPLSDRSRSSRCPECGTLVAESIRSRGYVPEPRRGFASRAHEDRAKVLLTVQAFSVAGASLSRLLADHVLERAGIAFAFGLAGLLASLGLVVSNVRARRSELAGPEPIPGLLPFVGRVLFAYAVALLVLLPLGYTSKGPSFGSFGAGLAVPFAVAGTGAVALYVIPIVRRAVLPVSVALLSALIAVLTWR